MDIAVCEDNAADTELICGFIRDHFEKNGYVGDIHRYESGEAMLAAFSPGAFDAVFLDIYMGGMTGTETAKRMREADSGFALVFITSSDRHAMEAFALRACAYVPKPIKSEAMETAMRQCRTVFLKNARFIEILTDRQSVKIPLIKIFFIEVYDKDVLFHTAEGVFKTRTPLDSIEKHLGKSFLRCHRSYIVNMNHIDRITGQDIVLKNSGVVPMRQRGRSEIREIYSGFLSNRLYEIDP